jgi:ubiquinone biosynthesis protein Coq4
MGVVIQGLIMGMKSKLLFAYQFELNWSKPVSEVRQELGISGLIE